MTITKEFAARDEKRILRIITVMRFMEVMKDRFILVAVVAGHEEPQLV